MDVLTRKEKADGWPEQLRIPSEEEFFHGAWLIPGDALRLKGVWADRLAVHDYLNIPRDTECGTQCCLVGWMGVAFNGPISPFWQERVEASPAHLSFARTILRLAGVKPMKEPAGILRQCSNVFEQSGRWRTRFGYFRNGLSPKKARKLWLDAAEHHGYDVSAFR